ncbi:MAG: sugar ABC transporter permease [Lachnospiraceae bacterium]|nr:sugar ABC transporter permease [Lachnospiraceae bacterium]
MKKEKIADKLYIVLRLLCIFAMILLFIPALNPARISDLIPKTASVFTCGTSYSALTQNFTRAFNKGWVGTLTMQMVFGGCLCLILGFAAVAAGGCMSLGTNKLKKIGMIPSVLGSVLALAGCLMINWAATDIKGTSNPDRIKPLDPGSLTFYIVLCVILIVLSVVIFLLLPKVEKGEKCYIETKYQLFLLLLPFLALCVVFSYLPLLGWRYAFFDYKSGDTLSMDSFVGLKWFTFLFRNEATRADLVRVLRNTLAMSGLGLATSWCSMAFAIFLCEIKNMKFRRLVQTFTTIPNFISWVLVYAVAFAIFSTDGFVSSLLVNAGAMETGTNFLMDNSHMWLKMLAWGMWKGLGWNAIIYIAAISGIDQQLYEAASIDGAGRFQKMWNITVPSLIPTFMVLFLMAIANVLSNGMDQYLVFETPYNTDTITVLDLYVYKLGINGGKVPLATVIGMFKSFISVTLLFGANTFSKKVRGESII